MAIRYVAATTIVVLFAGIVEAADKVQIDRAIKGGQAYLKAAQRNGGRPGGVPDAGVMPILIGGNGSGTACLTGLALVESGLDATDPVVNAIARAVRQSAFNSNSTYEISLMIMFLDRVASKDDQGLIQFLTLRLLTGQLDSGAWSYSCSGLQLDPVEERQLRAELIKETRLVTPPDPTRPKKKDFKPREDLDDPKSPKKETPEPKKDQPRDEPKPSGLHPALEKYARGARPGAFPGPAYSGNGDHSNTQFATVGLWCGRRHHVDVSVALEALDKHYRGCVGGDGGWSYTGTGDASSPSMTCAGLMGLAIGFGAKNLDKGGVRADPEAIAKDRAVEGGLKYVGTFLKAAGDGRGGQGFQPNELSANLYFMWSLERVGMVYGLTTIGNVDWYDWGSSILVKTQNRDGSWSNDGFHSGSVENSTAFALLFLTRSNLAEEVSTSLKGKVKDPGTSRLVGGGDLAGLLGNTGTGSSGATRPTDPGATRPKSTNPPAVADGDKAGKLAAAIIAAAATERAELLILYRDTKGSEYTDALARAATRSNGEAQAQVREALAQRLTRMTAGTLNEMMRDTDRELRRAAALASAAKGKERLGDFAANLIRLIADDEAMVAQAARASLKALTDKDFGPEAAAGPGERGKALIAWRNWWDSQKK